MKPSAALTAVLVAGSLLILSACAQIREQEEEAALVPPEGPAPEAALTEYERCLAECTAQTPGQRPMAPRSPSGVARAGAFDRTFPGQTSDVQGLPFRAAQAQCLSACDALRPPTAQ